MNRTTVGDIAKQVHCSPATIRRLADKGYIETRRDYNGWRIFVNPEKAVQTIQQMLFGEQRKPQPLQLPTRQ